MSDNYIDMDTYEPDYKHECINCAQRPVVTMVKAGKIVGSFDMCGPCTFGSAEALDPDTWNGVKGENDKR